MTVQSIPAVQCGVEIIVPLSKLKKSPRNARRTPHAKSDVEQLAASIAAKGVLQPPVVEAERDGDGRETGAYLVTIGEGRRLALALLAKRKAIRKSEPIRCLLDEANDGFEISLDENVTRFAMHPADQFEAFRELAETQGRGAEEIAVRFGVSAQTVRQRLRLAVVSPRLIAAYRAEELTLDQLVAFAVSEDQARQEQVFEALSYNRSPSAIRRMLTEHEALASDPRAVFVGAEAYEDAGGHVRRDLFAEDRGGWFEDVALLDRLALEKLHREAEVVRADEGWLWAEAHLAYPHDNGMRRLYPVEVAPNLERQPELAALSEAYDAIIASAEIETLSIEAEARLNEIEAVLEAASRPVYAPEAYSRAGLFAVLTHEGTVRIERGFVRSEEVHTEEDEHSDAEGDAASAHSPTVSKPKGLPDRLVMDLSAHRTAALRDVLASRPEDAILVTVHALALRTFYTGGGESCLELRSISTGLGAYAEGYADSVAGRSIEARHESWAILLPENPDALWEALVGLHADERLRLFAYCVSLTLNAVQAIGRSRRALADADRIAEHLGLDMASYWQATSESYFGRISKAQILETVSEAVSADNATRLEGMKKEAMAKAAADLLGPEGWLPPLLKGAAVPPA